MVAGFVGEFQKSSLVKGKRRRVRRKVDLGCLAMEGRWEELYGASGLAFLGLFYLLVSVSFDDSGGVEDNEQFTEQKEILHQQCFFP